MVPRLSEPLQRLVASVSAADAMWESRSTRATGRAAPTGQLLPEPLRHQDRMDQATLEPPSPAVTEGRDDARDRPPDAGV
jgi:hypothetical protein